MSIKKPFRAKPVVLGEYARAQEARKRRKAMLQTAYGTIAIATLVFVVGMAVTNRQAIRKYFPRTSSIMMSVEERQKIEGSVYFRGCNAARAAGAAPIYRGTPGYRSQMDDDNDGIACEPYIGL